jgi:nucleoside-diphosphate-sugar epimerase
VTAIAHDLSQPLPPLPDFAGATVVHCAAEIRAGDWSAQWRGNVEATRHVLDWAVRHGSRRVVLFSTGSLYGFRPDRRMTEDDPLAPDGPYAHSKRLVETLAGAYAQQFGLAVVTFRLYFPYGGTPVAGMFRRIEQSVSSGDTLTINRGGAPRVTPVHVDDVSAAVLMGVSEAFPPGVYNLCGGGVQGAVAGLPAV